MVRPLDSKTILDLINDTRESTIERHSVLKIKSQIVKGTVQTLRKRSPHSPKCELVEEVISMMFLEPHNHQQ